VTVRVLLVPLIALAVAACSSPGDRSTDGAPAVAAAPTARPAGIDLEIYAAASLRKALEQVKTAYEAANPGTTLSVSTDASSALETKIEQGAPADVFLSADTTNPQTLVDGGFASGAVTPFAGNALTIIVPADNPAGIETPADLATSGIRIVAAGDTVPISSYATQLVDNLGAVPGYPADFAAAYAANVVSREDNVAAIVTKIALGEGDAGIVYVTDARGSDDVVTVDVPAAANVPATYGGIVVKASPDQEAAAVFLAWLAGREGQAILADLGFRPPAR
jgi:molybdate transport system substrate-binding protein